MICVELGDILERGDVAGFDEAVDCVLQIQSRSGSIDPYDRNDKDRGVVNNGSDRSDRNDRYIPVTS